MTSPKPDELGWLWPQRNVVGWLGGPVPKRISEAIAASGVLKIAWVDSIDSLSLNDCRAVIVPFSRLGVVSDAQLRAAADCGCYLAIAIRGQAALADATKGSSRMAGINVVDILKADAHEKVVAAVLMHNPGPPGNSELEISGYKLEPDDVALVRRAFANFQSVDLRSEFGGLSGSQVFQVRAIDSDNRRAQPFLMKIGDRDEIETEVRNTSEFVTDYVPFTTQPPLQRDLCVSGATRSVLVGAFVERAIRLDLYLRSGLPENAIAALFDRPLRNWRSQAQKRTVNLAGYYQEQRLLPLSSKPLEDRLAGTGLQLPEGVMSPSQLLHEFATLESAEVMICRAHGDLNIRNVFVTRTGGEVILIDFEKTTEAHVCRDPATLDVSLAFSEGVKIPRPWLKRLYAPRILQNRAYPQIDDSHRMWPSRVEAIRQLRLYVAGDCLKRKEYDSAVAAQLLSACWKWKFKPAQIVLTYALASRLIRSLHDAENPPATSPKDPKRYHRRSSRTGLSGHEG